MLALDALQELQAGETRHGQVAEDQIRGPPLEGAQGLLGVLAALDVGLTLEDLPGELSVEATVVDHDDTSAASRLRHPIPPLRGTPASCGPPERASADRFSALRSLAASRHCRILPETDEEGDELASRGPGSVPARLRALSLGGTGFVQFRPGRGGSLRRGARAPRPALAERRGPRAAAPLQRGLRGLESARPSAGLPGRRAGRPGHHHAPQGSRVADRPGGRPQDGRPGDSLLDHPAAQGHPIPRRSQRCRGDHRCGRPDPRRGGGAPRACQRLPLPRLDGRRSLDSGRLDGAHLRSCRPAHRRACGTRDASLGSGPGLLHLGDHRAPESGPPRSRLHLVSPLHREVLAGSARRGPALDHQRHGLGQGGLQRDLRPLERGGRGLHVRWPLRAEPRARAALRDRTPGLLRTPHRVSAAGQAGPVRSPASAPSGVCLRG